MTLLFQLTRRTRGFLHQSYDLAWRLSREAHIDASHNEIHSKEVLFWSTEILRRLPHPLSPIEIEMTGHCALLHDLLDRKYTNFSTTVHNHLLRQYPPPYADAMIKIMNDMSYSKTVFSDATGSKTVVFPLWISEPFPTRDITLDITRDITLDITLNNVYHVVREADLLSSYNLARMVDYRKHKFPEKTDAWIRRDVERYFYERMDTLIEDGVFVHPSTRSLARCLHATARLKLGMLPELDLSHDLDLLKIVDGNRLNIDVLLQNLLSIHKDPT